MIGIEHVWGAVGFSLGVVVATFIMLVAIFLDEVVNCEADCKTEQLTGDQNQALTSEGNSHDI